MINRMKYDLIALSIGTAIVVAVGYLVCKLIYIIWSY